MSEITQPSVAAKFKTYPPHARKNLLFLRQLVLETAAETPGVSGLTESLKWDEPSFRSKQGSTIRMDWKQSAPDQYALYFHCTTSLVATFEILYGHQFSFERNRAIVFQMSDQIPVDELKHCIALALTYHRVKHLPLLGT